jgi:hypothetical protein
MSKKVIKLAVIRTESESTCPFGLPIPFGCKTAGKMVGKMASFDILGSEATEKEKKKIAAANMKALSYEIMNGGTEPCKCLYASKIFDKKKAVECNYDDSAPGQSSSPLLGAPFYNQIFTGLGLTGLFSYPIGYYADYNITRNLYNGIFSLQGSERIKILRKLAEKVLNEAETEKKSINKNE